MTPKTGTLEHNGATIPWSEAGDGPPILFIHGTAAPIWGDLIERSARVGRAISYARRGFGDTRGAALTQLSPHAEDAAALLDARRASGAVVVGWSIGGVIAAELAVQRPDLVGGLVLLEPPFWAKKHADLNLFNGVVLSILLGVIGGPARGGRRFSRWVFRERDGGNSLDRVSDEVRAQLNTNAAAIGLEIRGGTGEHLTPAQLAAIQVPTVVFAGDRGQRFLEDGARRVAEQIPGARFELLPGASHLLQLERSAEIAATLAGLLGHAQRSSA